MENTPTYFGTNGICGKASIKITPERALKTGQALGTIFRNGGDRRHKVVIGKDTRLSGYMLEYALVAGLASVGMDVILLGPMPTPAVAMLTREIEDADLGIMITGSHNLYADNGIMIFSPDGNKLSDTVEAEIEKMLDLSFQIKLTESHLLGRAGKDETNRAYYVQFAKMTVPGLSLEGLRIVVDCANGAAYKSAPEAFRRLGVEVIRIGVEPDGFNINKGVGSTSPESLQKKVRELRADIGVALSGDGSTVVLVDKDGNIIDDTEVTTVIESGFKEVQQFPADGFVRALRFIALKKETLRRVKYG